LGFLFVFIVFAVLLVVVWPFSWVYGVLLANFPVLATVDADDILSRITMVLVAGIVWYLYPRLALPSMRLGKLNRVQARVVVYHFAAGCLAVGIFYIVKYTMGHGFFDWSRFPNAHIWRTVLWYLLGALTVAFIEEIFFRGIVYKAFWQDLRSKIPAALLAAAFFGSLHWISFAWLLRWAGGKESFFQTFFSLKFVSVESMGMFLFITVLGLLLIYSYEYIGSLYAPIGLHAGMVFAARIGGKVAIPYSPSLSMDILKVSAPSNVPYLCVAMLVAILLVIFFKKVT
jgi:membrane protease YdiL (CAAX protease family)